MDKNIVIDYLGGSPKRAAVALGYKSTQIVYNWPKLISDTLLAAIVLRMKAKRIAVPDGWMK